jgi:hypothetical protein
MPPTVVDAVILFFLREEALKALSPLSQSPT